jgi:hypothetical protein
VSQCRNPNPFLKCSFKAAGLRDCGRRRGIEELPVVCSRRRRQLAENSEFDALVSIWRPKTFDAFLRLQVEDRGAYGASGANANMASYKSISIFQKKRPSPPNKGERVATGSALANRFLIR